MRRGYTPLIWACNGAEGTKRQKVASNPAEIVNQPVMRGTPLLAPVTLQRRRQSLSALWNVIRHPPDEPPVGPEPPLRSASLLGFSTSPPSIRLRRTLL